MEYDCIIVGAGVLGSSSAYQLAKDGYKVLLLDQVSLTLCLRFSCMHVRFFRNPLFYKQNIQMQNHCHNKIVADLY